jgi:FkbM family methyltransferase
VETWLIPYIPAGSTALDVGANHGTWSRFLAERFTTVYAIEPNPSLHEELGALAENVRLIPAGAWSISTWHDFGLFEDDQHTSAVDYAGGSNRRVPAEHVPWFCQRLDEMALDGHVGFMKIDVEGAEVEVLHGAASILEIDRPVVIVEIHTEDNGAVVSDYLKQWEYRLIDVRSPALPVDSDLWRINYWIVGVPQ